MTSLFNLYCSFGLLSVPTSHTYSVIKRGLPWYLNYVRFNFRSSEKDIFDRSTKVLSDILLSLLWYRDDIPICVTSFVVVSGFYLGVHTLVIQKQFPRFHGVVSLLFNDLISTHRCTPFFYLELGMECDMYLNWGFSDFDVLKSAFTVSFRHIENPSNPPG